MKFLYALIVATSYATAKPQVEPKQGLRGDGAEESGRKLGHYYSKSGKSDYYDGDYYTTSSTSSKSSKSSTSSTSSKSSKSWDGGYYSYEGWDYYDY